MPTRRRVLNCWFWLPALICLLAACSTRRGPAQSATAALPAATAQPLARTPLAATPVLATTGPAVAQTVAPASTTTAVSTDAAGSPTAAGSNTAAASSSAPTATAQPAGPSATPTPDPAVSAVLAYLDARARADVAAVTGLSCKTWKNKAVTEAVSFHSMNAKLVGVTCQVSGSAGAFTLVGCGGKMVTTYGTESRDWDLSVFTYQVSLEDGQWKMCGYH